MPSRRPLGTTVTISISQRKETSEGVRPGGSGWAIFGCDKVDAITLERLSTIKKRYKKKRTKSKSLPMPRMSE